MEKIADFVDAEELEELQAKRNQHQKLEEDLKEREQALQEGKRSFCKESGETQILRGG